MVAFLNVISHFKFQHSANCDCLEMSLENVIKSQVSSDIDLKCK